MKYLKTMLKKKSHQLKQIQDQRVFFQRPKNKKILELQESYILCTLAPKSGGGGGGLVALCPQSSSGT